MNQASIEGMLKDLMYEVDLETITGSTAEFIKSLNSQFSIYCSISPKQEAALRKIFIEFF